jgi:peroxiredoxin
MRSDIKKGNKFPDYELPDHTGQKRKISDLQEKDPVALVLARGGYCAKEDLQHQWMAAMQREVTVGYCRFITISTSNKLETKEWMHRLGAHWPFLTDEKRSIQQDLEIQEYTDPKHDPMIPHTILLEPGLKIYKIYNGYWYWGRPSVADLRRDPRERFRKIRPDWDISDAELREAWKKGERERITSYEPDFRLPVDELDGLIERLRVHPAHRREDAHSGGLVGRAPGVTVLRRLGIVPPTVDRLRNVEPFREWRLYHHSGSLPSVAFLCGILGKRSAIVLSFTIQ